MREVLRLQLYSSFVFYSCFVLSSRLPTDFISFFFFISFCSCVFSCSFTINDKTFITHTNSVCTQYVSVYLIYYYIIWLAINATHCRSLISLYVSICAPIELWRGLCLACGVISHPMQRVTQSTIIIFWYLLVVAITMKSGILLS